MGPEVLDLKLEVSLRPLGCPLEGHVLQEVGDAVIGGGFVPRNSGLVSKIESI